MAEITQNEQRGNYSYIYSNVCGESIIEGINAPLLRRVVTNTNKNKIFTSLYYIPVVKGEFNEIEIQIKNEKGALANYLKEPVTLLLHFRAFPFYV